MHSHMCSHKLARALAHSRALSLTPTLHPQGRDLRIMDPSLATSYPSAILCRDRALVVNLEHIKVGQGEWL